MRWLLWGASILLISTGIYQLRWFFPLEFWMLFGPSRWTLYAPGAYELALQFWIDTALIGLGICLGITLVWRKAS